MLKFLLFGDLRSLLGIPQTGRTGGRISSASYTDHGDSGLVHPVNDASSFSRVHITDGELSQGAKFSTDPAAQDLATLLLSEARLGEVSLVDESYDIDNDLVFIEDSVDNDWDERRQVGLAADLDEDHNQATSLEDGTISLLVQSILYE